MKKILITIFVMACTSSPLYAQESIQTGRLNVNCDKPGATVWVDGEEKGTVPMTLELSGQHNIRLEYDKHNYYRTIETIDFKPGMNESRTFFMKPMPPKTYGMVLANFEPSTPAFGATIGIVKRWGVYVRLMANKDNSSLGEDPSTEFYGEGGPGYYKKDHLSFAVFTAGLMYRVNKFLYVYGGAGYGRYGTVLTYQTTDGKTLYGRSRELSPYRSEGLCGDGGVILKWKALIGQVGCNMIFGSSSPKAYKGVYLGVGITLHKNPKR